jgi:hypothetical protein
LNSASELLIAAYTRDELAIVSQKRALNLICCLWTLKAIDQPQMVGLNHDIFAMSACKTGISGSHTRLYGVV